MDTRLCDATVGIFNIQFILGLSLYVIFSPLVRAGWNTNVDMLSNPILRFFVLEHIAAMFLAFAAMRIGAKRVTKTAADRGKFKLSTLWFGASFVCVVAGIPWPFLIYGRALFRLG